MPWIGCVGQASSRAPRNGCHDFQPAFSHFIRHFGRPPDRPGSQALASEARAGALGSVGGGYGDPAWTPREYLVALGAADTGRMGCSCITRKLDEDASALDWVLNLPPEHRPRA